MDNSKTMQTYIQVSSDVYIYIEYMDRHMQSRHKKSEFHLELDSVPCLDLSPLSLYIYIYVLYKGRSSQVISKLT